MRENLAISEFHVWFRDMVKHWIKLATDRCKDYTTKAISADSAITVTDDVMFSSSAVDTTGFLLKIGNFWKHLEWPVASVAYGFGVSVMQKITECSLFYVGEVFKKLTHEDMFDENGRFKASEKVESKIYAYITHLCLVPPPLSLSLFLSPPSLSPHFITTQLSYSSA